MFPIEPTLEPAFALDGAMAEAAALPGAQLFAFGPNGEVEGLVVIAPDRLLFELRTPSAVAWFGQLGLPGQSSVDAEATLAHWCEWVPRLFRGVVLGIQSPEDFEAAQH